MDCADYVCGHQGISREDACERWSGDFADLVLGGDLDSATDFCVNASAAARFWPLLATSSVRALARPLGST